MRINEIIWSEDRIEHIALHKVEPNLLCVVIHFSDYY